MHERASEAFAQHDVNFMQWMVLTKLREEVAFTPGDLCRAMRYDTGAFTRVLDELEQRGLIERERSRTDRRVVKLRLTADGRKRSIEFTPLVVDLLNGALANFSRSEFQELTRLLNKLIDTLDADESQGPVIDRE
jgi:DNA-binding MarR family transcriptional regulator